MPVTQRVRSASPVAYATYTLIALNLLMYFAQWTIPGFTYAFEYIPAVTSAAPWTMFTAGFLHSTTSITHILFNMYSLWVLGRALEEVLGSIRFLVLYLVSIFGASVAVLLLTSPNSSVVGASGGIFGLMAGYFVILKSLGLRTGGMVGIIGVNLVLGFIPGISWQAHLGGLVVGGLVAFIYSVTRKSTQKSVQVAYVFVVVLVLIGLTYVGTTNLSNYFVY